METLIFAIDIDGTICVTKGLNYEDAIPIKERIEVINNLHRKGHVVYYYTARGCLSKDPEVKRKLFEMTEQQLKSWGCLYTELHMDKRLYDVLVDDRAIFSDLFFEEVHESTAI